MPAEVESMFYVGETPWHRFGNAFETPPATIEEAINAAGLDWTVSRHPLFAKKDGELEQAPAFAIRRDDTDAILGVVGPRFVPLQNKKAFEAFQIVLDSGEASFETAGSLREGKRVWILAKLNRDDVEVVPGDPIMKYLLLSHGHDGTLAIRYGLTPIRVVCKNTESLALAPGVSQLFSIRHTSGAEQSLKDVTEMVNAADACFETTIEQYKVLASRQFSAKQLEAYVRLIVAPKVDPTEELSEIATITRTKVGRVMELAIAGAGNDLPGVRGTWWAAYNGVSQFLTHEVGRSDESRMAGIAWGSYKAMNDNALRTALALSQAA